MVKPIVNRMTQPVSAESVEKIMNFLKSNPVGVLSTVGEGGVPHGSVVYFSIDEDMLITFTTKDHTIKHKNISKDSHVMLTVFEAGSQSVVQVEGTAVDVTGTLESEIAFHDTFQNAVKTSNSGIPPISKLVAGKYVAYVLKLKEIRMAVYARPDPGGYEMFETISFEP